MNKNNSFKLWRTGTSLAVASIFMTGCASSGSGLDTPPPAGPGFIELSSTLLESDEEQAERIGPMEPNDPGVKTYTVEQAQGNLNKAPTLMVELFAMASKNDPAYQAALFEYQSGIMSADAASLAYTPSLNLSNRFLENEGTSRTTVTLSQPIFSLSKLATLQEEDSRRAAAEATLQQRGYELVERVMEAVIALTEANEQIETNRVRVEALEGEAQAAKREMELGQATITDLYDTQVRLAQAKSEAFSFVSKRNNAKRTLELLTKSQINENQFVFRKEPRQFNLMPLDRALNSAKSFNNRLISARAEERLAELRAVQVKSNLVPEVSYNVTRSKSDAGDFNNSGFNVGLSVPLSAGSFYQSSAASADVSRSKFQTESVMQEVERDVRFFHSEVEVGLNESGSRLQAIEAAELSRTANERSFKGGVRTRIDVLNSVQVLFSTREEYLNTIVRLTRNHFALSRNSATPVAQTISELQQLLF